MRFFFPMILLFSSPGLLQGLTDSVFVLDALPKIEGQSYADPGLPLNRFWRFKPGDDPSWASPSFNDSAWKFLPPSRFKDELDKTKREYTGWFRLRVRIDSSLLEVPLGLLISHGGASEIYIDGQLRASYGTIDPRNSDNVVRESPKRIPLLILLEDSLDHLIAIRYCNPDNLEEKRSDRNDPMMDEELRINIAGFELSTEINRIQGIATTGIFIFYFTFFVALSFLHFMFFLFYRQNKSNLYYSIFALTFGTMLLFVLLRISIRDMSRVDLLNYFIMYLSPVYCTALLAMLNNIFYGRMLRTFWIWVVLAIASSLVSVFHFEIPYFDSIVYLLFGVECMRIIFNAIRKKKDGAWILGIGVFATVGFFVLVVILAALSISMTFGGPGLVGGIIALCVIYATISIPVSMTIYLAKDFARTSRKLQTKLQEVAELSAKSIEQEKEKQKILESQKELLEIQVTERTTEIIEQKKIIEEKNKDITDSITYAKRIQGSMLPGDELVKGIFPDSFIFYRPKDIVSGDFFWFGEHENKKIAVCADCTGHGVPGALMSIIGSNLLNQLIVEKGLSDPAVILEALDVGVANALRQKMEAEGDGIGLVRDGMDVAVITYDPLSKALEFAGAQRPAWLIRDGMMTEIKGDKVSIGGSKHEYFKGFNRHVTKANPGDFIFLSTDGFADQFGGSDGKKLMTKEFKKLIEKYCSNGLAHTRKQLEMDFDSWRGNREQVDDVLVIGIKI